MAIAIALVLLVVGTLAFHFLSPWWFTPIASNWEMMDDTVNVTFWVTGVVFVAVNLFLAYAIWRFRHGKAGRVHYEPENRKLEWWLTIVTSVGIAAMLAPGLAVWAKFVTVPEGASVVEVVGQQWNWSYRFPGPDGELGASDARLISLDNPFGLNPEDPIGRDDILVASPELHLPINEPVKLVLRAKDVNHQYAVPQFRVKMDMVPGMITYFWFTPTRIGQYDALCEQLCGMAHFAMRGRVFVDERDDFNKWLATQPSFERSQAEIQGNAEAGQTMFATCVACHGPEAQGNRELNAPKLSGQASWYLVRQLHDFRHGVRGAHEQDAFGKQMVAFAAMLKDDAAIRDVVAYIRTLPEQRPDSTVTGDSERGREHYRTCSSCHGADGKGIWSTHAPRLDNMSDWYLARQLQNFRQGIRGSHPRDFYGAQMTEMTRVLKDEQAINDVVSYIEML